MTEPICHRGFCEPNCGHYLPDWEEIKAVASWLLTRAAVTKAPNKRACSYWIKHVFEAETRQYASNGSFILGCLLAHFHVQPIRGTPNGYIALRLLREGSA